MLGEQNPRRRAGGLAAFLIAVRVLVTRPPELAARTARLLSALGHQPLLAPVLEIAPTGAAPPDGPFDVLLATSAQAFIGLTPPARLRFAPLACVGEKTAEAGRAAGLSVSIVAPRAETLAQWLIGEKAQCSALYLAGRERKPILEERLREAGWRLEIVETYDARPVAAWPVEVETALMRDEIDAILHYSSRSAELALALTGADVASRLWHFCLSPEIAAKCRVAAPAERIVTASHPDEDSIMTLLRPAGPSQGSNPE
jgi:uroporphyrinogen-III synthase